MPFQICLKLHIDDDVLPALKDEAALDHCRVYTQKIIDRMLIQPVAEGMGFGGVDLAWDHPSLEKAETFRWLLHDVVKRQGWLIFATWVVTDKGLIVNRHTEGIEEDEEP